MKVSCTYCGKEQVRNGRTKTVRCYECKIKRFKEYEPRRKMLYQVRAQLAKEKATHLNDWPWKHLGY